MTQITCLIFKGCFFMVSESVRLSFIMRMTMILFIFFHQYLPLRLSSKILC